MISVLTTTLNAVSTIAETLASVRALAQICAVEHLLLDAGSTDGTWPVITDYVNAGSWARAQRLPGLSLIGSLNQLLSAAEGDYTVVLHGDDRLVPEAIAIALHEPPKDTIICGDVRVLSRVGQTLGVRRCDFSAISRYMSLNHPAMLVPTPLYQRVGMFDNRCPASFDYEWTWRAWRADVAFDYHPIIFAEHRIGGLSTVQARQAATEILFFRLRGGAFASAISSYAAFVAKESLRRVLPGRSVRALRSWKRAVTGTIDHYSE